MYSPTGYYAHYIIDSGEEAPDVVTLPVVRWNEDGYAVVCNKHGRLVTIGQQRGWYQGGMADGEVTVTVYPTYEPQSEF
jgi:hypothetical protein